MPQITDPALLNELNGGGQTAPPSNGPTIYRTPSKAPAPVRQVQQRGDELSNQQKQQSLLEGPLDAQKKRLDIEEKQRKLDAGPAGAASEGERKNAAFVRRAQGANEVYNGLGIGPRSFVGDKIQETAPGLLNQLPSEIGNSSDRQQADAAEREFVSAVLRSDSGAAIPDNEIATAIELYFPQPGDGEAVTQQKKEARQRAIDGLISSAGRLAGDATNSATEEPQELDNEQMAAYNQFITENPDITAEELRGYARGKFGVNVDNAEAVLDHFRKTGQLAASSQPAESGPSFGDYFASGVGDVVEGTGDILGIVGNPLNAGVNAALGTDLTTDIGGMLRDVSGLPDKNSEVVSAINKGGVGALSMAGLARPAAQLATGATANALSKFASAPGVDAAAGAGAGAASALAPKDSPALQIGAGLVGGLTAGGAVQGGKNLAARFTGQPNALSQAATRQKVDLLPADVGGPTTRRISGAAAQTPLSAAPVINRAQKSQSQIEEAVGRQTRNAVEPDEAGDLVRKGGDLFIKKTSERGSRLYDRAQVAAKGVTIKPKSAIAAIDNEIGKLSELGQTNAPLIKQLEKLKGDIKGGVSVSGLRDARTQLGGATFDGKLRSGNEQRIYKNVLASLSDDIDGGLRQAGKTNAANQFKTADEFWKQRVEQIDEVLQPIMGKGKGGEDILKSVESMARGQKGGVKRLSRLMAELPKEQAQSVRETVISRLGKATDGAQNDTGTSFSASTFLTNWNKMSPKGKVALFGNGNLRSNLDDIAKITNATKEAQRFSNHSNTSGGVWGNLGLLSAGGIIAPGTAITAGATQLLTGRLMASPSFANWLAKAPAKASSKYVDRLSVLATREPAIAGDAKALQNYLNDNFISSPGRAAAQETQNSGREPPKQ